MSRPRVSSSRSSSRRVRVADSLLALGQLGQAYVFFGNLYEAITKIPDRLATTPDLVSQGEPVSPRSLLRAGSPVRYHLPAVPVTFAAPVAALAVGRDSQGGRGWIAISGGCSISAGVITGYVVRTINLKLFFGASPLPPAEREELLRRWYRLNAVRLVVLGAAWLTARRARSHLG